MGRDTLYIPAVVGMDDAMVVGMAYALHQVGAFG